MKRILDKMVSCCFHLMQKNYVTFRILVWMREHGITRKVGCFVMPDQEGVVNGRRIDDMEKSKAFFSANGERIEKLMSILSDEKSKAVLGGVIQHREDGTPLKPELYSENDQYFASDVIKFEDGDVFIDGGGYTGDTVQQFMDLAKKAGVRYKHIVVFEPDEKNCDLIRKFHGKRKDVVIIEKGLSDEEKTLYFTGEGPEFRVVDSITADTISIPVINIDAVPECQDATWIKMDIEGSELDALHGASQVILRNRPKLTICIYHSDEDMLRIAEYVHELVPDYKLYIRHHKKNFQETVLYAVP